VSSASLERRFPKVIAGVFLNLQQAEGPAVAVTVRTFVDRYDELSTPNSKYGPEGAQAKELLAARGVTPAVVDEARNLLSQLTKVATAPISQASINEQEAALASAEDALWAWVSGVEQGRARRGQAAPAIASARLPDATPSRGRAEPAAHRRTRTG